MGKIRVHELAKELNVESKKMVEYLQKQGCNIKNHMSIMDEKAEDLARRYFGKADAVPGFRPTVKRIKKEIVEAERALKEQQVEETLKQTAAAEVETATKSVETEVKAAPAKAVHEEPKPELPKQEATKLADEAVTVPEKMPEPPVKEEPVKTETADTKELTKPAEDVQDSKAVSDTAQKPNASAQNTPVKENKTVHEAAARSQSEQKPAGKNNRRDNKENTNRDNNKENNRERNNRDNKENRENRDNRGGRDKRDNRERNANNASRDNRVNNNNNNGANNNRDNKRFDNKRPDNAGRDRGERNERSKAPAARAEVVYAPPTAAAKPDSRRSEKKRTGKTQKEQEFNQERINRFEKAGKNRPRNKYKEQKRQKVEIAPATPKKVVIGETIILSELAKSMHKTASELIKKLFEMGIMATINQNLESDTAILLADEFGVEVEVRQERIVEILEDDLDNPRDMKERPPVVTVMGHVDHGKTSLLDAIRNTRVTSTEAGGITQHIGAYQVGIQGRKITFLDTPGHEAFTSMRARGAQVTDIAVLVVAADDGIMPQTVEAINHAKAADVPIIVAINKIDKPGANVEKVKQELTEYELVSEDWGGDVIMVPVSAKQGINIETLLEMILLVAEVSELKANPKRLARGTVIEAKLDRARGPLATLLVQKGTLKVGETIIAGSVFGKVRAMTDDSGRTVRSAGPSMPVEILGFSEVPEAGETFIAIKEERNARYAAQIQADKKREEEMRKSARVSLDDLFSKIAEGEVKDLNIIIKADVRGSVEALSQSLEKLSTDEVKVKIIHIGVGAINESDVMLADASNAIIIGFNVRPDAQTRKAAENAMVDMRLYSVIYDAIEDVKQAMQGLLAPVLKETWQGQVEVRNTFKVPKIGLVAGGYVQEGKVTRNSEVRIIRDGVVIFQGKLASLKRFKDDVKEVMQGFECGLGIENYNDIKDGDIIEAFIMEETAREL